ncbi:MAG: hypothetical protein H7335_12680 [Massilia sp.]|nr:hypothetical protein [Massilia sp.]
MPLPLSKFIGACSRYQERRSSLTGPQPVDFDTPADQICAVEAGLPWLTSAHPASGSPPLY